MDVVAGASLASALEGLRPNPANSGRMAVSFVLSAAAAAQLELVEVKGRVVASRDVGSLGAGRHRVDLEGERKLGSGVYLVRLTQGYAAGRTVRRVADATFAVGRHVVAWDGKRDKGQAASSGIYFVRLHAPGVLLTRKTILIK